MNPPEGRIVVGETVLAPGGRRGRVVTEQLIPSNGACRYRVTLDDGTTVEHFDYELQKVPAG